MEEEHPVKRIVAACTMVLMTATASGVGADGAPRAAATPATATTAAPKPPSSTPGASSSAPETTRRPVRRDLVPIPVLEDGKFPDEFADYAVQVSYVHIPTGFRVDSANSGEIRTCLSICKIYIADHVFRNGTAEQKKQATEMLRTSDDGIATRLYRAFPKSMNEVAEQYGLHDTKGARTWGKSVTTMHDVATFLAAKVDAGDLDDPVLAALADPAPIAADGYHQDFGTDVLPGVIGTKWGWADKRSQMNASASYGEDFVVALNVIGDADATTKVAEELFTPAPRGEIIEENGELVAASPEPREQIDDDRGGSSAGSWVAGLLLLATVAGVAWIRSSK